MFIIRRRWVCLGALVLVAAFAISSGRSEARDDANAYRQLKRFSEVLNRVHSEYVEETEIEDLMEAAIRGMLDELDAHSQFMNIKQFNDLMIGTKGSFGGLGIVISIREDVLTVIAPIEGTPASRMGIQGGDQILYIEDESTMGFTSDDAVTRLRGPEGTEVSIKIRREGEPELLEYTIIRAIIKLKSVPYKFVTDEGVGYVRVSQFSKSTAGELEAALDSIEAVGINGLVLDLRSNPGGLLDQAVAVSDIFLDGGQMITYTQGRKRSSNNRFYDQSDSRLGKYPLVVLVDEHSASASEIVAGAVQDWDRGLVVGKTTFGKGSVQSVIPLDEETGLKLTTAKYYTPSGRCIQRDELNSKAAAREAARKRRNGEEEEPDEDREIFHTNAERPVYGGGGITPDIELDQRKMEELEAKIERRGLFFTYSVDYFAHHSIDRNWEAGPEALEQFKEFLAEKEIEFDEDEWDASLLYVRNGIKREIFRKAFGDQAAYEVLAATDEMLRKTFDLFRQADSQEALFALSDEWRLEREREEALAEAESAEAESLDVTVGSVKGEGRE